MTKEVTLCDQVEALEAISIAQTIMHHLIDKIAISENKEIAEKVSNAADILAQAYQDVGRLETND
jgi:hypothetical protein